LDGNLRFCEYDLKSVEHRRENGVDTLKLHHDTLSKTRKKTLFQQIVSEANAKARG